tara:strand:+ start:5 stop:760 length:756 start_codon:yes stop_codon:yes gene_type:complete
MKSLMLKAAKAAGKIQMKHYGKIKFIKTKEKKSYFTNVDLECEKIIINAIREKFPKHNIVSEESKNIDNKSDYTWYIDPLDGTHNYIHNLPLFGVSIALAHNGEVKLGVINLPYFNELYTAEKGKGSFLNKKRIKVSNTNKLNKAFVIVDMAIRNAGSKNIKITKKLNNKIYDFRSLGSAVYNYVLVAKGDADAYIASSTNAWDVAAGALIVEEAGGKVTSHNGEKWFPENKKFLTGNGKINKGLLRLLRS